MNCKKCNQEMKKSGPYADNKAEGEAASRGPNNIYYTCMNTECDEHQKSVSVLEK